LNERRMISETTWNEIKQELCPFATGSHRQAMRGLMVLAVNSSLKKK
jgi:hypothetical protein